MIRTLLLLIFSAFLFSSGTYTGWRAARWLDPILDAKAHTDILGGLFDERPQ